LSAWGGASFLSNAAGFSASDHHPACSAARCRHWTKFNNPEPSGGSPISFLDVIQKGSIVSRSRSLRLY
jgi:hypothetical protein